MARKTAAAKVEVSEEEKARVRAEAGELGISVKGKSHENLLKAIAQGKGVKQEDGGKLGSVASKAPKGAKVAIVSHEDGEREFSKDVHGDDWADNALEFAGKREGREIEWK